MPDKSQRPLLPRLPLTVLAAVVLLLAAIGSCIGLWYLRQMHDRAARVMASQAVVGHGDQIADFLADISPLCATNLSMEQWRMLYRLVDGLHAARPDLQFVSITRNGDTIINHQAGTAMDNIMPPPMPPMPIMPPAPPTPIERSQASRQVLELGGKSVPVMVFRREITLVNNDQIAVEVALRRSAVDAEGQTATEVIRSLFRLSMLTVALAFGACLLLLLWVVKRDHDHAERRRQEEHLAFSGMLANGIVHDFRNPMSSVKLDAQMLEREIRRTEGARPERMADLSGRISRTVERMDKVFQEFLYLARPAEEAREAVDLSDCVRECVETLAPRFEQAGVMPAMIWPAPPPRVMASPFALRRALLNVLMNAVQFAPAQSRVEVDAHVAGNSVELDILDRGPGIPAAERRRIFEMFVTTRPGGTGLGLFLARTAVRKCGGEIVALERPGGGTLIRITLPLSENLEKAQ